jgi:hypothetical protein
MLERSKKKVLNSERHQESVKGRLFIRHEKEID